MTTTLQEEPIVDAPQVKRAKPDAFVPRPVIVKGAKQEAEAEANNYDFESVFKAICVGPKFIGDEVGLCLTVVDEQGFPDVFVGSLKRTDAYRHEEKAKYAVLILTYKGTCAGNDMILRLKRYVNLDATTNDLPTHDEITVAGKESYVTLPSKGPMAIEYTSQKIGIVSFSLTATRMNDVPTFPEEEKEDEPESKSAGTTKSVKGKKAKKPKTPKKQPKEKKPKEKVPKKKKEKKDE